MMQVSTCWKINGHDPSVKEYANHEALTIMSIAVVVSENECVSFVCIILAICGSQLDRLKMAIAAM